MFCSIWKFEQFSCDELIYEYFPLFLVLLTSSRSNSLTSRSTTEMVQLLLHLRDNMHHYQGHVYYIQIIHYIIQQRLQMISPNVALRKSRSHIWTGVVESPWQGFLSKFLKVPKEVLQGLERLLVQCCVTTTVEQLQQQRFLNSGEWLGIHLSQVNIMRLAVHIQEETRAVKMREETMKG